ncbi:hypothetical protein [Polaromonas sp. CG9_12]|nr:hypothetical protein [Polaromonas sp. CG9_12]
MSQQHSNCDSSNKKKRKHKTSRQQNKLPAHMACSGSS